MHYCTLAGFFLTTCFVAFGVSASVTGGVGADAVSTSAATVRSKIRFDLDRLDPDGLQGPRHGLRALHYEYCIPDRSEAVREVTAIDPTLQIQGGSPGRVGCAAGELLCLGHTHQPDYRVVLEQLATLPFIAEIHEAFFE